MATRQMLLAIYFSCPLVRLREHPLICRRLQAHVVQLSGGFMHKSRVSAALAATVGAISLFGINGCGGDAAAPLAVPSTIQPTTAAVARAPIGSAVPVGVVVRSASGAPVKGVQVAFSVTRGSGSITPVSVLTDADGNAASSWNLSFAAEENELQAAVTGLEPVVFATMGTCPSTVIQIGGSASGTLAHGDCEVAGNVTDTYDLVTPEAAVVWLTLASTARLTSSSTMGNPIASDDQITANAIKYCIFGPPDPFTDGCHTVSASQAGSPMILILGAGRRTITLSAENGQTNVAYSLAVETSGTVSGCVTAFFELGSTTEQQLQAGDCHVVFADGILYYSDDMKIYLAAGQSTRVRMSSTAFTPWVDIFSPTGQYLGGCVGPNPGAADCTFVASVTGYHLIAPSSFEEAKPGSYTLTVE